MMRSAAARAGASAWIVAAMTLTAAGAQGGPAPPPASGDPRPRTCLVLGGGGARGGAHVGVLKVLEELRVPVDCLVGTSMGAIVGGLWVTGIDPAGLEKLLRETDWEDLLSDRTARRDIPFRRKQDDNLPLFRLEFGLGRRGLELPSGLVAGQKFDFALRELTVAATTVEHFDELAIPFRAVATDLADGSPVALDRGDLVNAMRASAAVPGAFSPVDIDGRSLIDGGVVANVPVFVAVDMGAERIIAVDVSAPLEGAAEDRSAVGVAMRTVAVLTLQNVSGQLELLEDDDVLIAPALDGVRSTGFADLAQAIAGGERAARAAADALRPFAVPEDEYHDWADRFGRWREKAVEPVKLDAIKITGLTRVDPRIVRRRVHTRPGSDLDVSVLASDLAQVYRLGDFERVAFDLEVDDERATTVLEIEAREKRWGPNFVRFGMGLQADFEGRAEFNILADLTRTRVNALGAEVKALVALGEINGAFVEFYQPLDFDGFWFVAPRAQISRRTVEEFEPDGSLSEFRVDRVEGGADIGAQFRSYGEIRAGIRRGRVRQRELTAPGAPLERVDLGAWRGSLILDRLDNANFPRWGSFFGVGVTASRAAVGADDEYNRVSATYFGARSVGSNTFLGRLRWGSGLGSEIPLYDHLRLGGFLELSGLPPGALRGPELGFAQIVYYRQVGRLPGVLGGGLYVGVSAEAGNVWDSREEVAWSDLRPAGLVWAGVDTILGPLYLGYGRTDGNQDSFYFALGQSLGRAFDRSFGQDF